MFQVSISIYKYWYICIYCIWETDGRKARLVGGEWGSRGADTLAPLPWVTLLLSFCALASLPPPSSSSLPFSLLPNLQSLLRSHSHSLIITLPSPPPAQLKALISPFTMPKHFYEQEAREENSSSSVSAEKPLLSHTLSRNSRPTHLPVPPLMEKNHTLVNSHGSFQSPWMVTSGVQIFWAWSMFIFFFLSFTIIVCWLCVC